MLYTFYFGLLFLTLSSPVLGENCQEVNSTYWICADQVTRPNASSLCSSKYGYILLQPRQQADFDFWKSDLFSSKSYWIGAIRTDVNERFHWENSSIDVPIDYFRSGSNQDARVNYSCVSFEPTYLGTTTVSGYALEARQCDIRRGYVCQNPQDAKINMLLNVSTQAINILETTSVTTASESRNISVSETSSYVTTATKSYVNGMLRTSVSVISGSEATSDVTAVTDSNCNSISVTPPSASIMSVTTSYVTVAQLNVNSMPATRTSANSMLVTPPSANTMLVTPTSASSMSMTPTSVHSMSVTSSNANTPLELNTSAVTPATTNQNTLTESLTIVSDSRETNASRAGETTIQLLSFRPTETVSSAMSVQPSLQQQFSIYPFPAMPTPSTAPNTTDYAQTSFTLALPTAPQPACLSSCPTTPAYTTDTAATASVNSTPTSPPYTTKQAVQTSKYLNLCSCRCTHEANPTSLSQISKKEILLDIKNQLHVDVKNASSTIRRLTSAEDKRRSAQILGSIGVIVLVTVLGCILVLDFTRLVQCDSRSQDISVKKHRRKKMTKKALK
ncbi:cell wall protein DAN4 [Biomphalaria pfeifferi]|uniref:Cell wall protein DAN4 n=1 Tax=Biomphalaria pfeifferi TaxID=112525 RepID=A0AAD8FK76_BIOPF|nr:cell wall protein DAN4 [Biomphalaria pfeifferi]